MEGATIETISWETLEYNHKKKSPDFIWTIILVTIVACVVAVWLGNFVFGIFIFISGGCLLMFSIREPGTVRFMIANDGLMMGKNKYPWKNIKGFNILPGDVESKLMIETTRYFLPIYTITLPASLTNQVRESIAKFVPQIQLRESNSMILADKLGF